MAMDGDKPVYNSNVEAFREAEYPMLRGTFIRNQFGGMPLTVLQMLSILTMLVPHYIQSLSWKVSWPI